MDKSTILPKLFAGAQKYNALLLDKNFLFIGGGIDGGIYSSFEAIFEKRNFMHLTGCKIEKGKSANQFFDMCMQKRLSPSIFSFVPEAKLKMDVFSSVFSLPYSAKMMGDFSDGGNFLYTEKIAGTVCACMGFTLGDRAPYYSPNTVLKEDIRNITAAPIKILAVYQKATSADKYDATPVSIAKNLKNKELLWPQNISSKIITPT